VKIHRCSSSVAAVLASSYRDATQRLAVTYTWSLITARIATCNLIPLFFSTGGRGDREPTISLYLLDVFLTVHHSIDFFKSTTYCTIPLFFNNVYVTLRSSTCFEQKAAHPQEDQLYHHILWYRHPL